MEIKKIYTEDLQIAQAFIQRDNTLRIVSELQVRSVG